MSIHSLAVAATSSPTPHALPVVVELTTQTTLRAMPVAMDASLVNRQHRVFRHDFLTARLDGRDGIYTNLPQQNGPGLSASRIDQTAAWDGRTKRRLPMDYVNRHRATATTTSTTAASSDVVLIEPTMKWLRIEGKLGRAYVPHEAPRIVFDRVSAPAVPEPKNEAVSVTAKVGEPITQASPSLTLIHIQSVVPFATGLEDDMPVDSHLIALCTIGRFTFDRKRCHGHVFTSHSEEQTSTTIETTPTPMALTTRSTPAAPTPGLPDIRRVLWPDSLVFPLSSPLWLMRFPQFLPWRVAPSNITLSGATLANTTATVEPPCARKRHGTT